MCMRTWIHVYEDLVVHVYEDLVVHVYEDLYMCMRTFTCV